jgi:hypothetical protein
MEIFLTIPKMNINKIAYNGSIVVSEEISKNITLVFEANKCSLDMKTCEKYTLFNIKDLCQNYQEKYASFDSIFDNISPRLGCPIKAGNYTIPDALLDMSILRLLPVDGFIWVVKFKLVASSNEGKSKKIVMCIDAEIKLLKTRKNQ